MKINLIILAGIITLALLCSVGIVAAEDTVTTAETTATGAQDMSGSAVIDEIPPYDGPIGADSPLYGLKLAWEDFDESFTTNESERVNKQMDHARLRLSEVRRELAENRSDSAEQALGLYWQKVNLTQARLAYFGSNETGLLHAQEMHAKHQIVLENLLISHPNNTGLARAYNNSLDLELKFQEKTQTRFEKVMAKNNQTIVKAYRIEVQTGNRAGEGEGVLNENRTEARNEEKIKTQKTATVTPQQPDVTTDNRGKSDQDKSTPSITASPQAGKKSEDNGQGNGNSDDKANGNSRKT
ncbi:MAG: DUF5667 domain-containing protein [Methanoregula sp.]|nr:DUF5667 domain-containing protein [Methanoregula sp.]